MYYKDKDVLVKQSLTCGSGDVRALFSIGNPSPLSPSLALSSRSIPSIPAGYYI